MSARTRLLEFLREDAHKPMKLGELCQEFDVSRDQRKEFASVLEELREEGYVFKNSSDQYGIPEKFNLILGRVQRNPKGFAFLIPDNPEQEDIFITTENMNGAMHNDKVFVRYLPEKKGKRREGEVIRVIERANKKIVGELDKSKYYGFVVPDNKRIYNDVFVPKEKMKDAKQGQKVVARIVNWPEKNRNPEGEIVEILGYSDERGVDIEAIIRQLDLPQDFPVEVKNEVRDIPTSISQEEISGRRDLRELRMFTIDGDDAKDFDDAVSIEKLDDNRVRLGVHIADVTHYVKEGSTLDEEALERGTSIYLVDRVIPMLPEKLSNNICSLRPEEERLTMSVIMDFQPEPLELLDYEICNSVIKSDYRLTYDKVQDILEGDKDLRNKYSEVVPDLELMNELRSALREERFSGGSIDFNFPEVKVILDDQGRPVELEKREHREAEQLIEEFMICANQVVAEDMYWREIPFIYRVHDQPDPDTLQAFNEFIHNFGYHLKGSQDKIHPRVLGDLLEKVEGKPEERVINTVLLRSMKKAIYSPHNIGHFGLSLEYYSHFTSPIRRYPDLMIHRVIKEVLAKGHLSQNRRDTLNRILPQIADHCSLQERQAMDAERDSVDLKKIEYMQDKIGEEYEGIISGVTGFGFFVELENTVEGLVHVEDMRDDYYHLLEDQYALVGERTKNMYRLGDIVKVKVARVDLDERELDFTLVED
ncbi:MAG: ribonuclease R [Halanaerobiales bacterium]